jgi:hypothetical protein
MKVKEFLKANPIAEKETKDKYLERIVEILFIKVKEAGNTSAEALKAKHAELVEANAKIEALAKDNDTLITGNKENDGIIIELGRKNDILLKQNATEKHKVAKLESILKINVKKEEKELKGRMFTVRLKMSYRNHKAGETIVVPYSEWVQLKTFAIF